MGSDSWRDIRTWREWETVLTLTNHIVVTRPGYEVSGDHLTEELRERILDLRGRSDPDDFTDSKKTIFFTDAVNLDIAASSIRRKIREKTDDGATMFRLRLQNTSKDTIYS